MIMLSYWIFVIVSFLPCFISQKSVELVDLENGMRVHRVKMDNVDDPVLFLTSDYDTHISGSLRQNGVYDENVLRILMTMIRPNDIVIDVGANIGAMTIPMAKRVAPRGQVYAFEPVGLNFYRLSANIAINDVHMNVVAVHAGVGSTDGDTLEIPILTSDISTNLGSFSLLHAASTFEAMQTKLEREGEELNPVERVTVRSLDAFNFPRCPSFIKIDAETMELDVLQGGKELVKRCQPIIHAENNCIKTSASLLDYLHNDLNYACYWDANKIVDPTKPGVWNASINVLCVHSNRVFDPVRDSNLGDGELGGKIKFIGMVRIDPTKPLLSDYPQFLAIAQSGSMDSCQLSSFTEPVTSEL